MNFRKSRFIRENWSHGHRDRVLLKMELELKHLKLNHLKLNPVTVTVTPVELKHLKLNPVTVTVTPVFPVFT